MAEGSPVVQSYVDFMQKSDVKDYTESNHFVHSWDHTAIAGFDWSMTWVQDGKTDQGSGQDMFVFERRTDRWVAVLRVMLFSNQQTAGYAHGSEKIV